MSNDGVKSEVLRARCEPDLKRDVKQIANFQGLDEADIVRIACKQLIQRIKTQPLILTQ